MASSSRPRAALSTTVVVLLSVGVVLVVTYVVLDALDVGGIGDPTDIGGGLMLLAGYLLIAAGVVWGGINWLRRKRHR